MIDDLTRRRRAFRINPRRVNAAGLALIKQYEGLSLRSYRCPAGRWTVGYGHTRTTMPQQDITEDRADALLLEDLKPVEQSLVMRVAVPLNDNQFAALACLVFNIGVYAFEQSTLLACINRGDKAALEKEWLRWVHVGTVKLAGLVRRRTAEWALWNKSDPTEQLR